MDIQKAREKFAEINLKEGFYTEEELSITDLGIFEYTAAEQDWEKWWECLIYYVEPMLQAQKVAVPEGYVVVPKDLPEHIAEKLAIDRVDKPRYESDSVWNKIAEKSYKDKVKFKKCEFMRDYKAMIEAQEQKHEH